MWSSSELCRKSSSELECEIFGAIDCSAVPGSHGIRKFGEARGTERGAVSGTDRQGHLDSRATFFATYRLCDCYGILWDYLGPRVSHSEAGP